MKSSAARTASAAANGTARRTVSMSPEPSPPWIGPRRTTTVPIRQSAKTPTSAANSRRASPQHRSAAPSPPLGSPREGNSPASNGNSRPTSTTRRQVASSPSSTVKGFNSQPKSKQILSHDFLTKSTTKSRGPSMLTRSIEESNALRRHSAPGKGPHDFLSRSHDHGSLAAYRQDRGPKSLSTSQDRGPRLLSKSYNQGPMSLSKSQDKGFMSRSHDRDSLSGFANQRGARKVTVPAYGFDGRRLSTGSRDVTSAAHRISDIKAHYQNRARDVAAVQLQMGRSVDSTVSLSTTASSQRQSFRDAHRLSPQRLVDAEEEASRRPHRQLKSPDFFDVKKVDGDVGGVITAVSRMYDPVKTRRDSLAGSARKAFTVETAADHETAPFNEINYKLEKELSGANELLEIDSWNEDDEEYLQIYKGERGSAEGSGSFVDILEDESSKPGSMKWAQAVEVGQFLGQYENALYDKSEPGSDLGTSTKPSPQTSPPRASAAAAAAVELVGRISSNSTTSIDLNRSTDTTCSALVSRISSNSATSIDLNRSTDTTCSTHSQYDSAFWGEAATFRPWNPKREAEMALTSAATSPADPPPPAPVADPVTDESRISRYNDGLERLTTYMKTASQSARKRRGLSDDLSSSQASGCFDYLVDFLESQQSITDVLVSAHDQAVKSTQSELLPKRTAVDDLSSSRSIESRVTDLGSEASWESGKSRSVQTLGTTGKVMDQITEKVDSLSFDSPKHLSTFKFGLKKTTVGAFETITSSDQVLAPTVASSAPSSRTLSQRSKAQPVSCPQSPKSDLSWRSQTAPSSHNLSRTPSHRICSDKKLDPLPLSTDPSSRQINVVSEGAVESRSDPDQAAPPEIPDSPRKASPRRAARQKKSKPAAAAAAAAAAAEEAVPVKDVQMHDNGVVPATTKSVRLVESAAMKAVPTLVKHDNLAALNQANKGCGCTIL